MALGAALLLGACEYDPLTSEEATTDGPRAVAPPDLTPVAPALDLATIDKLSSPPDLAPPSDFGGCPGRPCDVVCQNCGHALKCTLDGAGALACLPTGSALPGHACTAKGADDCSAGAVCLTAALSGAGACFRYCHTSADCPGNGVCAINVQGTTASVCTDPVSACAIVPTSVGCSAGTSCYPVNDQGQTGCHLPGDGGLDAACNDNYDCLPGYACFVTPIGCQKLCRKGNGSDCPLGRSCTAVGGWTTGLGICT